MEKIEGELSNYSKEINDLMNGTGKTKLKDLMIQIVNDIYDEKISINALVDFNNIIRENVNFERIFMTYIPGNLLGHTNILNNVIESIDRTKNVDIYDKVDLFEKLSDKSISSLINNKLNNPIKYPVITYKYFRQYNLKMNRKLGELLEKAENNPDELKRLEEIENKLLSRASVIYQKEKASINKNDLTLNQEESQLLKEINERLGSHDYYGTQERLKNIPSQTVKKLLSNNNINSEWVFLLPNEVMEENKSTIIEKIVEKKTENLDVSLMDYFMQTKSRMESGLSARNGLYRDSHDEINAFCDCDKSISKYKFSVAKCNGLEFFKSNYEEFAKQMNMECATFEELEEKYMMTVIGQTLIDEYGLSGKNRYGEEQKSKSTDIPGEKEYIQIKNKIKDIGEQASDICRFSISNYEESLFVALTKDEEGKEYFRMFNHKGEILNNPKAEIELNENGEFVFPENPLDDKITSTKSGNEITLNEIIFKNFEKEVSNESLCQFVVPNIDEGENEPGIRYCVTKGTDGRIEMKMANSLVSEKQLMNLGTSVECFRVEEVALLKKYQEFGITNENLTRSVYGLKKDKSISEPTKEESRGEL